MALFDPKVPAAEHEALLDENDRLRAQLQAAEPTEWLERVMTRRLIVHMTSNQSIDGSLVAQMDDGIVLRAARLLDGTPQGTAMAGEVFIPRDKVAFAQLDG